MPNFLIIGAAKAGTTALYFMLNQHPEIYMSPMKETNFFALEGKTLNFKGLHGLPDGVNNISVTKIEDYQALFEFVPDRIKAIGEASPSYLYLPETPKRIKHHIPNPKLIVILRNPAERAYSAFVFKSWKGEEPFLDFAEALTQEDQRIKDNWTWGWHYKNMGFYYEQLSRYFNEFDRSQIMVCLHEDLQKRPQETLQSIYDFLEVDRSFVADSDTRYHSTGGLPKNKYLHSLVTKSMETAQSMKVVLKPLIPKNLRLPLFYLLNDVRRSNSQKQPLPLEIRKQLISAYHDDILNLQELIQRDLESWLKIEEASLV